MKLLGVATFALATALTGGAQAKVYYDIAGSASAGEVVEIHFQQKWLHSIRGTLSFEGGDLDFATLTTFGSLTYIVEETRQKIKVDASSSCAAPVDMPCSQFSNLMSQSIDFETPYVEFLYTQENIDFVSTPPPGRLFPFLPDDHVSSMLVFGFVPAGAGEVSYRLTAVDAVPEPTTWAMLILGFATVGAALRNRPGFPVTGAGQR